MATERPVYATAKNVTDRLGENTLSATETPKVETFLRRAHNRLRRLDPDLDLRVEEESLDAQTVQDTIVEAVWRAVQDDRIGWRVRAETWPEAGTEFDTTQPLNVYFTAEELADLGIADPAATGGAFTINGYVKVRRP